MIRTAFHDPLKGKPLFTLHDDVERIYTKMVPALGQLDAMFERMWSTPIQTLVQEADPEVMQVNTIEDMFEKLKAEADAQADADADAEADDADNNDDDDAKSVFTTMTGVSKAPWAKANTTTTATT
ncbi:MAG: hypothetical protein ACK559_28705, partial [bacterium]